jgi:hypothetical protein
MKIGLSTRSEKSGTNDWIVLGIRGLEAVQVSSHRGPPTDRPPYKPREVGVFAGCLQERAGTHHLSRLASFSRGFNCSSGNASPLADNAIWGSRAIEQFRVRAAGTSHGSRAELEACEVWCGHPTTPKSAGSMVQRDNRLPIRDLMHHPMRRPYGPLSGAAKYPAGARPSKCYFIHFPLTWVW